MLPYDTARMKALVTGGAGFIGSNLVDALLARGDDVVIVDNFVSGKRENLNPGAQLREHDIREPFEIDADVVFHLAAQADVQTSMKRPGYDAAVNVVGTVNVLQAAKGAQVIFASSGGTVYGECTEPAKETAPKLPGSAYGVAKLCAEQYLEGWNRMFGTQNISLRFGNVYGPRQDSGLEGGVVSIFLERMARGEPTTIFGDGTQARDYVYVDDLVAALLAVVGTGGDTYNVGTGVATPVSEIHSACAKVAGVADEPVWADARHGDMQKTVVDPAKIAAAVGWSAQTSLEDGLARTWAWLTR